MNALIGVLERLVSEAPSWSRQESRERALKMRQARRFTQGLRTFAMGIGRQVRFFALLSMFAVRDARRYANAAFGNAANKKRANLRAKIAMYAHALEKGLSHSNLRVPFGKYPVTALVGAMEEYVKAGYADGCARFAMGLAVLDEYATTHASVGVDLPINRRKIDLLFAHTQVPLSGLGGVIPLPPRDHYSTQPLAFDALLQSRRSVREYTTETVDPGLIVDAIRSATLTPSSCNRQPWRTYLFPSGSLAKKLLALQGGINGYQTASAFLILITTDQSVYGGAPERNASFIDGGMFASTLLYAIHSRGLGACALNASLSYRNEETVRRLAGVNSTESIVCFIIAGYPSLSSSVPVSHRDDFSEVVRIAGEKVGGSIKIGRDGPIKAGKYAWSGPTSSTMGMPRLSHPRPDGN